MKRSVYSILAVAAVFALSAGCSHFEEPGTEGDGGAPEGYASVEVKLKVKGVPEFATRAGYPLDKIDNVNLFWFTDQNGNDQIDDTDPLIERRYFEYGTRQDIYLKRNEVYFVYVVANLEDIQCPNGDLSTYFDDVQTFGDLKKKYILNTGRQAEERTKIVMAADKVTKLNLDTSGGNVVITPEVLLERVFTLFKVNVFNRVAGPGNPEVASGVNPVSITGLDFIRGSYLYPRGYDATPHTGPENKDFRADEAGYPGDTYFSPGVRDLIGTSQIPVEYPERSEKWYTKYTFDVYTLENRLGDVDEINQWAEEKNGPGVKDVYGRNELAPEGATCLRINSLIAQNAVDESLRGMVLYTWVHAGKGRTPENNGPDKIDNFDVDRNTIYHFNIVIDGIDNVRIDTRREYLNKMVLFELQVAANSVDAHYVDMPAYITGNATGFAKIESGTGDYYMGTVTNWDPMLDNEPDDVKWLRFSTYDPLSPDYLVNGAPVTWYTPEASTAIYLDMTGGGLSKRRILLHFNENVKLGPTGAVQCTTDASGNVVSSNPPTRMALVRIAFVEGATSPEDFEKRAAEGDIGYYYQPMYQYGLKTVGPVGGYVDNEGYTKLLGVESVEESQVTYYTAAGLPDPPPWDNVAQLFWQYRTGRGNTNHAYDGRRVTTAIYDDYRGNSAPPQRGQPNLAPAAGLYNPFTNTNAADYCMRKNRDENGDGIISGNEVKWYLPTPAQMTQIYQWREAFNKYALNFGYLPLWGSTATNAYWTANDSDGLNALVMVHEQPTGATGYINTVKPAAKTARYPVRCVRDIEGSFGDMFYISENGELVANLKDYIPGLNPYRVNEGESQLRDVNNNNIAPVFIISRWYANDGGAITNTPALSGLNNIPCTPYRNNDSSTGWVLPSERELALIYSYANLLENLFEKEYPGAPLPNGNSTTFHYFQKSADHWATTNIGNNSTYWYINFGTGASGTRAKQSTAFSRCIRYLDPNGQLPAPKQFPE